MTAFIELFGEQIVHSFPQISGFFLAVVITAFLVHKASRFYHLVLGAIEKINSLENEVKSVKLELREFKQEFNELKERFIIVEERVRVLWFARVAAAKSPRQLNEQGKRILKESGVKELINERKDRLLRIVKKHNFETAYDAEKFISDLFVKQFQKIYPGLGRQLKDGAFRSGVDVDLVLYVGSLYFRDQVFPELGFKLE